MLFDSPPSTAAEMVTFAFLYFFTAAGVIDIANSTFEAFFATETVTPSLVAFNFLATVVALFAAAIIGSFHFVIWPAKIFATTSLGRRTVAPAGEIPSRR